MCPLSCGQVHAYGATIDFSLTYNSFNADGSQMQVDTGLGFGWTHAYNIFLFSQRGHMFRMDGNGLVTKYRLGPGGSFTAAPGYFETLVKNPDGSFTLRQKHGTVFTFARIPNTPFLVEGPVFRLTRIVDRNNNTTTLEYTNGNLTRITDTYGRSLSLSYNGQNKLVAITDPLQRTTTLAYDPTGRQLLSITDPAGKSIQHRYNFMYQLTQKVDKDGRTFSYVYQNGKPVAIQDGAGDPVFSLSNPTNWAIDRTALARDFLRVYLPSTVSKTDGRGNVWQYTYDANGYPTQIIAPDGATTTTTYDPATLRVASVTDANGHTTRYEYDALGNLAEMTNALGHATTYTYEPMFSQKTSMMDPNGRVTTYEYDARGNRIRETDPLGHTREWTYDAHGNVLTEKDKNGHVTTHAYDAFGNRIKTTDALGQMSTMTYDAVGNLLSRTDANGHTTTFAYDGLDRLIHETDPLGGVIQTVYDGSGNRIQVIDCNGNRTVFEYDLRQRLVKITDALGQMTTTTYDGNDNRTAILDKNGHLTTLAYDVQNRLIQITDALGNTPRMTYDGVGNKLTETDANGHTTTYMYDALNRLVLKTDAVGCVTRLEYDTVGLPGCPACTGPTRGSNLITAQTDGNGKVTYFGYDGLDRLIKIIRKEGDVAPLSDATDAVTMYTYDPHGNRLSVTEPNGNTTTYEYDAVHRLVKETNAAGDVTRYAYDGVGNIITLFAPNGNVTTNTYDAKNRLIRVEDLVGSVVSSTYDCVGNRLSETDGNGNSTTFTYDAIYRPIKGTDPLGEMTRYAYDPVGNLSQSTDREGQVTTHADDAINRRISTTDALGNTTQYHYDGVGNLVRIIDANGHATDYVYDGVNRLIKETYADGGMRTFTYDCVGNLLTRTDQKGQTTNYVYNDLYFRTTRNYPVSAADQFTYDLSGRMLTAARGGWLVTFTYDGANRVIQTTQNGKVISYVYNIPGRTRTITYPGGRVVTEQKDVRERLDTIDDAASPPPIGQYVYDPGNRVIGRTYRNGTVSTYTYNPNNWVTDLEHTFGVTRVAGFGHAYDQEGNKRFEEKRHGPTDSEAYQYDAIYRLIAFRVGTLVGSTVPVPVTQTQYTLDQVGNWDKKTTDGVMEIRMHNEVNELIKIDAAPLVYDANGNLIEDGLYLYAYDEENRLIHVTRKADSQVVGQYQYDALSRRVVTRANPAGIVTETRYFYDDARIIEEQDTVMVTQATYVYGNYIDEVLTMDRAGQTYYYHQNSLWSVMAVTDSTALVVERYAYDAYGCVTITTGAGTPVPANPWGTPHSSIGNPYMFTGRQLDEETGLYYYRARYYACMQGRFLQRDPLGYVDGMNLYEYVRGNPTNWVDPSGQKNPKGECDCTLASLTAYGQQWQGPSAPIAKDLPNLGTKPGVTNVKAGDVLKLPWNGLCAPSFAFKVEVTCICADCLTIGWFKYPGAVGLTNQPPQITRISFGSETHYGTADVKDAPPGTKADVDRPYGHGSWFEAHDTGCTATFDFPICGPLQDYPGNELSIWVGYQCQKTKEVKTKNLFRGKFDIKHDKDFKPAPACPT